MPLRAAPAYDPKRYEYNIEHNLIQEIYPEEFEFYWQKKQAERALKSRKSKKLKNDATKSLQNLPKILPPIVNSYGGFRNFEFDG